MAKAPAKKTFLRIAIRLGWRDACASRSKFLLIIVAIAVAVAIVTAVLNLSETVHRQLILGARQWLAGDIQVRGNRLPSDAQLHALEGERLGGTVVTETAGQISALGQSHLEVAGIKAVDPASYPFYGTLTLKGGMRLSQVLHENTALVSADVLEKLHTRIGAAILVSGAEFQIAGVIDTEPDRFAVMPLALMRVLLTREGFERTGMLQRGSSAIQRILIRIPESMELEEADRRITQLFPYEEVIDYKKNAAGVAGIEEQAATYFSFLAFMILIVASLGVGLLMYTHVQQRIDTIVTMKMLGATTGQVVQIYLFQIAAASIAGACFGFFLGAATEQLFPFLLHQYLPFSVGFRLPWKAGLEASVAGVLVPLLLSSAALLAIRKTPPNAVLRRNVDPPKLSLRERIVIFALAAAGIIAASSIAAAKPSIAVIMSLGLACGMIACAASAFSLRLVIPAVLRLFKRQAPAAVRYGALNLIRPGSGLLSIVMALGLGVCFVYIAYLIEGSLMTQVLQYSPFHGATLYILNVGPSQKLDVLDSLHSNPSVRRADLDPFLVLRLISINGNSHIGQIRRTWFAAVAEARPASVDVSAGRWWTKGDATPSIALSARAAAAMGVHVGDSLAFSNGPELVSVRVAAIHRGSSPDALRYHLTLNPTSVTDTRVTYNGAVWIDPDHAEELQRQIRGRFPSVMMLNQTEIAAVIQDTAGQVASVLGLVSAISLTGGVLILCASMFATRFRREQEIAVLKALGATRKGIVLSLCAEFTLLGLCAAIVGIAMGSALANLLGRHGFDPPLPPFYSWSGALAVIAITIAVTNGAGWITGISLLSLKPSEILRASDPR